MTRRILLALLAFTAALLLVAVVPLGVAASNHDQEEYKAATLDTARSLATAAEEDLADRAGRIDLGRYTRGGAVDGVVVVDRSGRTIASAGAPVPGADAALASALRGAATTRGASQAEGGERGAATTRWATQEETRVLVASAPVGAAPEQLVGAIAITRRAASLDDRLQRLWLRLVGVSLAAALVAAALAVMLARWIGRPVRALEMTAGRLGDGALDVRAPTSSGPPEVRRLATAFNAMAGRLETLVHGSRAVVADVSHQLRTPLAAIRLRLELLRDEVDGSAAPDLQAALGEVDRLSRMVDGMLAVARAESATAQATVVDVGSVVDARLDAWHPLADERGVRLTAAVTGRPLASAADGHVEQVLDNLLANSLDALEGGGTVQVRCAQDGSVVRLEVVDDGPGMSQELRAVAFHRFVTERADGRGTGLGLAIVHRLVTTDGGHVRLEETPGGGLTAVVELPPAV